MNFELETLPFAFETESMGEQQEARRGAARSAGARVVRARVARASSSVGTVRPPARARPRPRQRPLLGSRVYYPMPVYDPFAMGQSVTWPEPAPSVSAAPPPAEPAATMPPFGAMPGFAPGQNAAPALMPEPFAYPPAPAPVSDTAAADDTADAAPDAGASAAGADDGNGAGEIPQALFDFLRNNRTNPQIPQYDGYKTGLKRQGKLIQDVVKDPALKGKSGVYLITFEHAGKRRAYSGKADDLQVRLKKHLYTLSFPVGLQRQYMVYVQPTANGALARSLESQINRRRAQFGPALVNRTTELELALFA